MEQVGLRLGHLGFGAGMDCLEHGIYMTAEHARYMAEHGVALVPTLSTMHGIYEHGIEYGMPESWIPIAEAISSRTVSPSSTHWMLGSCSRLGRMGSEN
jgi:imidazolonepropionase-like amidohydrolase